MNRIKHENKYYHFEDLVDVFLTSGASGLTKKISEWPWPKQRKVVDAIMADTSEFASKIQLQKLDVWYEEKQIANKNPKKLPKKGETRYYKSTQRSGSRYVYLRVPVNMYSEGGDMFKVFYEENQITIKKREPNEK